MSEEELKLKCLELAMEQAKREGNHQSIEEVAKIQTRFYNLITGGPSPDSETKPGKKARGKVEKGSDLFE